MNFQENQNSRRLLRIKGDQIKKNISMRRQQCEAAENVDMVRSGEVEVGKER